MSLPLPLRLGCIGASTLAAFVLLASWTNLLEAFSSMGSSEIHQVVAQQQTLLSKLYAEDAQAFSSALISSLEARQSALNDMRTLRTIALFCLAICATSLFMSGWRLLLTQPPSRPQLARTLSKTALACAVFRTLDGAQSAALARRSGAAFDSAAAFNTNFPQHMETALTAFSITFSFFITAFFLWCWRYFQSPKTLAVLEMPPPSPPG